MTDGGSRAEGLLASMRGLFRTLIDIAQTRLAIFTSDLEEQGACFAKIAVYAALSAVSLVCALVMAVVFVIMVSGEHRLFAVCAFFILFFLATLWSWATFKRHLTDRPKLLAATLAEIEKDKAALTGSHEVNH